MQNGYLESFSGKFRDERLNVHWFRSLDDARRSIEGWRISYTAVRPRSALCGQTPTQCAFDEQAASHAECLTHVRDQVNSSTEVTATGCLAPPARIELASHA